MVAPPTIRSMIRRARGRVASALLPFVLLFVPASEAPVPGTSPSRSSSRSGRSGSGTGQWLSVVQLVIATATFGLIRAATGHWLLSADMLRRKGHLVARTVFATLVAVVTLPLVARNSPPAARHARTDRGLSRRHAHRHRRIRERVLTKDGRTVVLKAMAHQRGRLLSDALRRAAAEVRRPRGGLTDRGTSRLPSATGMAKMLGLTQQPGMGASTIAGQAPSAGSHVAPANPRHRARRHRRRDLPDDTIGLPRPRRLYSGASSRASARSSRARARRRLHARRRQPNAHVLAIFDEKAGDYTAICVRGARCTCRAWKRG